MAIKVISQKLKGICFPTDVTEINPEHLESLTERYNLAKHYAIIAICQRIKIFDLVTMLNTKRNLECSVTTLLAKVNEDDWNVAKPGDIITIDRTDIERGSHIINSGSISSAKVSHLFNTDDDLRKSFIQGKGVGIYENYDYPFATVKNAEIYLMEFKIVPVMAIKCGRNSFGPVVDPYAIPLDVNGEKGK